MKEHNHTVSIEVDSIRLDLVGDGIVDLQKARSDFVEAVKDALVNSLKTIETEECDTHRICAQFRVNYLNWSHFR